MQLAQPQYASLQPVNLGEIGDGQIPYTALIDATGAPINHDGLE